MSEKVVSEKRSRKNVGEEQFERREKEKRTKTHSTHSEGDRDTVEGIYTTVTYDFFIKRK